MAGKPHPHPQQTKAFSKMPTSNPYRSKILSYIAKHWPLRLNDRQEVTRMADSRHTDRKQISPRWHHLSARVGHDKLTVSWNFGHSQRRIMDIFT